MSRPIHVDELELTAFRGIRGPLPLSLTAPLTILYAANGTGKSSVCQAAEWLLTGGIGGIDSTDIGFRLEKAEAAKVAGNLSVGGDRRRVERNIAKWRGNPQWEGKMVQWERADLLNYLTPTIGLEVPNLDTKSINDLRCYWLKSAHFLYGTNLSVLIDSDKNSLDQRKQIFADLLGTGHLNRAIDDLEIRYAPKVRQGANLLQRDHIKPREDELTKLVTSGEAGDLGVAERELAVTHEALGLADSASAASVSQESLAEARARIAQHRHALAAQRTDIHRMRELWPLREQYMATRHESEVESHRLAAKLLRWKGYEHRLSVKAEQIKPQIQQHRDQAHLFNQIAALLTEALRKAEPAIESRLGSGLSRGDLQDHLPSILWTSQQREQRCRSLIEFRDQVEDRENCRAELMALHAQRQSESAHLVTPDLLAAAEQEVALKAVVSKERASAYSSAAGPLQQLRLVGLQLVETLKDDGVLCPLCRHDWKQSHDLHDAIREAAKSVHPVVRQLEAAKQEAESNLKAAEARLAEMVGRMQVLRRIDEQAVTLQRHIETFDEPAKRLGLGPDDAFWMEQIAAQLSDIAVADLAAALLLQLDAAEALLNRAESGQPQSPLIAVVWRAKRSLQEKVELSNSTVVKFEDWTVRAESLCVRIADKLERCRRELDLIVAERTRLEALFFESETIRQRLALVAPDFRHPDRLFQWLVTEEERVARAERHHAAAQAIFDVSVSFQRRQVLIGELGLYRSRQNFLHNRHIAASGAIQTLKTFRNNYARRQLQQLLPVVNALFARVHANRVVDDIVSAGEDPLLWLADERSGGLDPLRHFSQGQRQDLALAIFIARARKLGGTFFMDEPLVHLDDLNRVAVFDILRVIALTQSRVRLVLTTANHPLVRHLQEKFAQIRTVSGETLLNVVTLEGSPRDGVRLRH